MDQDAALVQSDIDACSTWGRWGADDQLGALNLAGPEQVRAADCADDGVAEVMLVACPLPLTGASGAPVSAVAIE